MLLDLNNEITFLGALSAVSGTGSGLLYPDGADRPFTDNAARDVWAAANLGDLIRDVTIVQVAPDTWYIWTGETNPSSYDNSLWVDGSRIVQGPAGMGVSVSGLTDDTLPLKVAGQDDLGDSPLSVNRTLNRLVSSLPIEVPPGTLYVGANTAMGAAIRALNVRSDITGNTGLLLAQLYDETDGFSRPFGYSGDTITQVEVNDPPGTDTSNSAQFSITTTEDELIFKVDIPTGNPNTASDFTLTIRTQSHTGPVAVDFSGSLTSDAQGVATLDLRTTANPILVDDGTELFIMATCDDMQGVQNGPNFTPNATVHRIVIERKDLAFRDEVSPPPRPQPSIPTFRARGQAVSVPPGTTLTGDFTFDFVVNMPSLVQGNLQLLQGSTVLEANVDPTDTSVTTTITDVTLAAGEHVGFTLQGTSTTGQAFSNTFQIRAPQPAEIAYWGIRPSDDFATVALDQLTQVDVTANDSFDITGAFADGAVVGILMPSGQDLSRITTLATPVTDSFSRDATARVNFILYTLTNSGGIAGQAAYTVEVR